MHITLKQWISFEETIRVNEYIVIYIYPINSKALFLILNFENTRKPCKYVDRHFSVLKNESKMEKKVAPNDPIQRLLSEPL